MSRISISLQGVAQTMLWPLYNRAKDAVRRDRLIEDPMAVDLVDRIDFDFRGAFGAPTPFHAIRARICDACLRDYLAQAANPGVIALGEGLETQRWRVAHADMEWITVDLPEAIALRRDLLPEAPSARSIPRSALDLRWIDEVRVEDPPFISAAGLLMYFKPAEVRDLLTAICAAFPGAWLFFDVIPPALSRKTLKGWKVTRRYTAPPMPWGVKLSALDAFADSTPGLRLQRVQSYCEPFPARTPVTSALSRLAPAFNDGFMGGLVEARAEPRSFD